LPSHLKWLLDASFKLFYWAKVQTRNVHALDNQPTERKLRWKIQFDFYRSHSEFPLSLLSHFLTEYDSIIHYLTTEHNGVYLTAAQLEELLSTVDPKDPEIHGLQMAWQSCCSYLWDIQRKYDVSHAIKPPFVLHRTTKPLSNLPIDITMAATAEQPWSSVNRVSKSVWMQRINLPLASTAADSVG
jgi:hypothetical protein